VHHKDKIDAIANQVRNAARNRSSPGSSLNDRTKQNNKRAAESVQSIMSTPQQANPRMKRRRIPNRLSSSPPIQSPAPRRSAQPSTSSAIVKHVRNPLFTKEDVLDVISFLVSDDRPDHFLEGWRTFSKNVRQSDFKILCLRTYDDQKIEIRLWHSFAASSPHCRRMAPPLL
jgi:hypothetical protein